jgi:putative ribosome biogenesis GTPase RsgA
MKIIQLSFIFLIITTVTTTPSFSQSRKDIEKNLILYKNNKVKTIICLSENGKEMTSYDINDKPIKKESYENSGIKIKAMKISNNKIN